MAKEYAILTEIRRKRYVLLIDNVDFPMRNYLHTNKDIPESFINYRKKLLDMTKDISGIDLDSEGNLTGITWPTKPEIDDAEAVE